MTPTFADNEPASRYELHDDGALVGYLEYRPAGRSTILAHTEVLPEHEGHGYGGQLVRRALDAARAADRTVIPTCGFAISYLRRHPELADVVDPSVRGQL